MSTATRAQAPATSRRMLVALGAAGGLLPSPSAFLVLVSGILTGRVLYALSLVAVFALGMAVTLSVVGIGVLRGSDLLSGRGGPALAALHGRLPVLAAYGVLAGGLIYLGLALRFVAAA